MRTLEVSHGQKAKLVRGLASLTIALSAFLVLLFLFTAFHRLRFPFELDRMESAMMTTVWRVVHGLPVYEKPSLEWVPFLYTPVFFYCAAALTKIVGVGYAALRLVSILATLGSCAVIFAMVHRETRNVAVAAASAGLFAGLYGTVLSWYDIGRVDSLSVFFFLAALYCTRFAPPILAAIVWVIAFQTKQSFLPLAVVALAIDWQRPRRIITGLGAFALLTTASIWLFNHYTGGWYSYYVFGTVSEIKLSPRLAFLYIPFDLVQPLGIVLGFVLLALLIAPPSWRSRAASFYGIMTLIILGGVGFARGHEGSYLNTLIPAYAWLCVLFGLAIARVFASLEPHPDTSASPTSSTMQIAVWIFVIAQLSMHLYRPGEFDPSDAVLAGRAHLIDSLRQVPGDVWLVNHSYDSILAGKGSHAEMDALDAVLGRPDPTVANEIRQAFTTHHFSAIMLDRVPDAYTPHWLFMGPEFRQEFPQVAFAPNAPLPTTGDQPVFMYLTCNPGAALASSVGVSTTWVLQGRCPTPATEH